jgi:hypothetical protein
MSTKKRKKDEEKPIVYGDPEYSAGEDIYSQANKVELSEEGDDAVNEGQNLDIPGAELDDDAEMIGEEDEENNYYSLGGEDHEDLEEDQS